MRLDARGGGGTDPCGVSGCERGRLGEALSNCPSPTKASTASPLHLTRAMQAGRVLSRIGDNYPSERSTCASGRARAAPRGGPGFESRA